MLPAPRAFLVAHEIVSAGQNTHAGHDTGQMIRHVSRHAGSITSNPGSRSSTRETIFRPCVYQCVRLQNRRAFTLRRSPRVPTIKGHPCLASRLDGCIRTRRTSDRACVFTCSRQKFLARMRSKDRKHCTMRQDSQRVLYLFGGARAWRSRW